MVEKLRCFDHNFSQRREKHSGSSLIVSAGGDVCGDGVFLSLRTLREGWKRLSETLRNSQKLSKRQTYSSALLYPTLDSLKLVRESLGESYCYIGKALFTWWGNECGDHRDNVMGTTSVV